LLGRLSKIQETEIFKKYEETYQISQNMKK